MPARWQLHLIDSALRAKRRADAGIPGLILCFERTDRRPGSRTVRPTRREHAFGQVVIWIFRITASGEEPPIYPAAHREAGRRYRGANRWHVRELRPIRRCSPSPAGAVAAA